MATCGTCGGSGKVTTTVTNQRGQKTQIEVACPANCKNGRV
jgi:hypothetical protein